MSLILVTKSTTAPAHPYDGQVWVDTTTVPVVKVYDAGNTTWITLDAADADVTLTSLGITSSAAELNILDGVTSSAEELNILDGVVATKDQINAACGYATGAGVQQIILPGAAAITSDVREVLLSDNTTGIAATIADASDLSGRAILFKQIGASAVDHTIVITTGTWDGTNKTVTFQDANDAILVWFDFFGNGTILENVGSVALSA